MHTHELIGVDTLNTKYKNIKKNLKKSISSLSIYHTCRTIAYVKNLQREKMLLERLQREVGDDHKS